ncbi:MAG: TrmH family RNA methyltransferase [Hyphomicrobiaceae bacterium]
MTGQRRTITSLQNDTVKLVRSLEMRKVRRDTGLFLAEGASVLITARDHGWTPKIFISGPGTVDNAAIRDLADWAHGAGADHLDVNSAVLEKLAAKDNPQSVMAVFEQRWLSLEAIEGDAGNVGPAIARQSPLWVVLEEIRDPGNLGTILRTADAAGATGVLLVGNTCDPYSREAVRASMGSVFAMPIGRGDLAGFSAIAGSWAGEIVGTSLLGAADYRDGAYRAPVMLVMGNEGRGISDEAAALCNRLVRIPMMGQLDSLNLAVATGLMLYEIRRPVL